MSSTLPRRSMRSRSEWWRLHLAERRSHLAERRSHLAERRSHSLSADCISWVCWILSSCLAVTTAHFFRLVDDFVPDQAELPAARLDALLISICPRTHPVR